MKILNNKFSLISQKLFLFSEQFISTRWFIFVLFAVIFSIRFVFLSADPPTSASIWVPFDEGWWVHNARNKILFGQWILDDYNTMFYAPLFNYLVYLIFSAVGVGLFQARLISAISGCLMLIFFYLFIKNSWNRKVALVSVFLLGFCHVFLRFNRIAFPESLMLLFFILTLYFWEKAKKKAFYGFFSGICLVMAYFSKYYAIVFFPIMASLWIWERYFRCDIKSVRYYRKFTISFLFGIGLAVGIWLLLFIFPNYADFKSATYRSSSVAHPSPILWIFRTIAFYGQESFFKEMPILLILSLAYITSTMSINFNNFRNVRKIFSQINLVEFVALSWFVWIYIFSIIFIEFPRDRRLVVIIPSMCILSAKMVTEITSFNLSNILINIFGSKRKLIQSALWFGILVYPIYVVSGYASAYFIHSILVRGINLGPLTQSNSGFFCALVFLFIYGTSFIMWGILRKAKRRIYLKSFVIHSFILILVFGLTLSHFLRFVTRFLGFNIGNDPGLDYISASLFSLFLIYFTTIFTIKALNKRSRETTKSFSITPKVQFICLLLFIIANSYNIVSYANNLSFTIVNSSRELRNYFNEKTKVIGRIADILCIENKAFPFSPPSDNFKNVNLNPIQRFHPSFALINMYRDRIVWQKEGQQWKKKPEYLKGSEPLLDRFYIWPQKNSRQSRIIVDLYAIKNTTEKDYKP